MEVKGRRLLFFILVPIAYLLLISAVLLIANRIYKHIFHIVCILFFLTILILYFCSYESANLELLTIGLFGIVVGYVPIERINAFVRHPYLLAISYLCYVGAITLWNVIYPLQVLGVCLSLMILYLLGQQGDQPADLNELSFCWASTLCWDTSPRSPCCKCCVKAYGIPTSIPRVR